MDVSGELESTLLPLIKGLGLVLVELSVARHRGNVQVKLVLYKNGGISLDDLSEAQKTLRPRLELEFGREKLSLEISSPGINRNIKSAREYDIFKGRDVRILVGENWITGQLDGLDGDCLVLAGHEEPQRFRLNEVRKARLE